MKDLEKNLKEIYQTSPYLRFKNKTEFDKNKIEKDTYGEITQIGTDNIVEIIDSGVYAEGDIYIYTRSITVRATGSNKPIIDGASPNRTHCFRPYASGNVFQGLHMRNFDNGVIKGENSAGYAYILSGCIAQYDTGPMFIGSTNTQSEIRDCLIQADDNDAIRLNNVASTTKVLLTNNVIACNFDGGSNGNTINIGQAATNVTMSYCTVIAPGKQGSDNYNAINQVAKVINCIVSGSGDGINALESTYNLVFVSGDPFITWSGNDSNGTPRSANTGEITGNPLFVNGASLGSVNLTSGQSYALSDGSPAIATGVNYLSIRSDISGNYRTNFDMGAYAFESTEPLWSDYEKEPVNRFGASLSVEMYKNLASNQKFRTLVDPGQAPFSRGIKGVPSIRNPEGDTPYKNNND